MKSRNIIAVPAIAVLLLNPFLVQSLTAEIPPRYHTYDEVVFELDSLAGAHPDITRLEWVGVSTEDNLTIWALKISNRGLWRDKPAVLYNGIHHAEELLGAEICMYMAKDLLTRYGVDPKVTSWVDNTEIWLVPIVNPDGHRIVFEGLETWRKNKRDNNSNGVFDPDSDGVDLNRNYDFGWEFADSTPSSPYYRGSFPFSESETQALYDLATQERFVFNICYHSARTGLGEVIYYPWRWEGQFSPDHPHIKQVADSMAYLIVNDAGNGTYASIWGNANSPKARNWFYGVMGTFTYTVEVSTGCVPPGEMVDDICERNLVGAYYLLDRVHGSSVTGTVADSITGFPLEAEVRVLEAHSPKLPPRMSNLYDDGRYRRVLVPGVYTLEVSKDGYWPKETRVVVNPGEPTHLNFQLRQIVSRTVFLGNSPNPFNDHTVITFAIPVESPVRGLSLRIYDLSGQMVYDLSQHWSPLLAPPRPWAGRGSMVWDGRGSHGRRVADGVYFCLLESENLSKACKLVLLPTQ